MIHVEPSEKNQTETEIRVASTDHLFVINKRLDELERRVMGHSGPAGSGLTRRVAKLEDRCNDLQRAVAMRAPLTTLNKVFEKIEEIQNASAPKPETPPEATDSSDADWPEKDEFAVYVNKVFDRCYRIYLDRAKAYGPRPKYIDDTEGYAQMVRIKCGRAKDTESFEARIDSLLDLINYAVLWVIHEENKNVLGES